MSGTTVLAATMAVGLTRATFVVGGVGARDEEDLLVRLEQRVDRFLVERTVPCAIMYSSLGVVAKHGRQRRVVHIWVCGQGGAAQAFHATVH